MDRKNIARSEQWAGENVIVMFRDVEIRPLPGSVVTARRNKADVIRGAVNHDRTGSVIFRISDDAPENVRLARLDDDVGPITVKDRMGKVLARAAEAWKQEPSGRHPGWTQWTMDAAEIEIT
jgi:hypothetical protein